MWMCCVTAAAAWTAGFTDAFPLRAAVAEALIPLTGGRGTVTATTIGNLVIGVATTEDVKRFAGNPEALGSAPTALSYQCSSGLCHVVYMFGKRGFLAAAFIGSEAFSTAGGTRIGMTPQEVRRREPTAARVRECGVVVYHYRSRASDGNRFDGLSIVVTHGHVTAFLIASRHERPTCGYRGFVFT